MCGKGTYSGMKYMLKMITSSNQFFKLAFSFEPSSKVFWKEQNSRINSLWFNVPYLSIVRQLDVLSTASKFHIFSMLLLSIAGGPLLFKHCSRVMPVSCWVYAETCFSGPPYVYVTCVSEWSVSLTMVERKRKMENDGDWLCQGRSFISHRTRITDH